MTQRSLSLVSSTIPTAVGCARLGLQRSGRKIGSPWLSLGEILQIEGGEGARLLCLSQKIDLRSKRLGCKLDAYARQAGGIKRGNL